MDARRISTSVYPFWASSYTYQNFILHPAEPFDKAIGQVETGTAIPNPYIFPLRHQLVLGKRIMTETQNYGRVHTKSTIVRLIHNINPTKTGNIEILSNLRKPRTLANPTASVQPSTPTPGHVWNSVEISWHYVQDITGQCDLAQPGFFLF